MLAIFESGFGKGEMAVGCGADHYDVDFRVFENLAGIAVNLYTRVVFRSIIVRFRSTLDDCMEPE